MPPKNRASRKSDWVSHQDWNVVTIRKPPSKQPAKPKMKKTIPPKRDENGDIHVTLTTVSNKEISKIIRARNSMNLTQQEFAYQCGVNVSEISRIERGDAIRVPQTMSKILSYIDKSLS